jgi:hypothetical protein
MEESFALVVWERETVSEESNRVPPRTMQRAALVITDESLADSGQFGELRLRQLCRDPIVFEEVSEG